MAIEHLSIERLFPFAGASFFFTGRDLLTILLFQTIQQRFFSDGSPGLFLNSDSDRNTHRRESLYSSTGLLGLGFLHNGTLSAISAATELTTPSVSNRSISDPTEIRPPGICQRQRVGRIVAAFVQFLERVFPLSAAFESSCAARSF